MLSGTWNKDNPALCRYMASLGHNVFNLVHFTNTYSNKNDRCWFLLLNIAACLLKRLQCGDQPKILYYIFTLLNTGSNLEKKLKYGNIFLPTLAWCQTLYATRKTIITFLVKHIRITNDFYIPYTKSCCIYTMLTFLQWHFSTTETIVTLLVNMWILIFYFNFFFFFFFFGGGGGWAVAIFPSSEKNTRFFTDPNIFHLFLIRFCGIHLRAISQLMTALLFYIMSLKTVFLGLLTHLPVAPFTNMV